MLLNRYEIRDAELIQNTRDGMYGAASYNIRVDRIILSNGRKVRSYLIPPLGTVKVVSIERMKIPENIIGYATVKTTLSNDGIFAINIGLLDPKYEGLVSTVLVNFGKNAYRLSKETPFLRLTFHRLPEVLASDIPTPNNMANDAIYVDNAEKYFVRDFSKTFLNIEENTRKFIWDELKRAAGWVAVVALGLALMTFLLNFGNLATSTWYAQRSAAAQVQTLTAREFDQLRAQSAQNLEQVRAQSAQNIEQLRTRVDELDKQMQALKRGAGGHGNSRIDNP